MRNHIADRDPRPARSRGRAGATVLLAVLAVVTGCTSDPAPAAAPSVTTPISVA
ncbi:MAG: hypothetical protein QOK35_3455, partial [Pseudonocardiales bacterium]|nr:hypothetical protein [Pseudonocardiales bacterium]